MSWGTGATEHSGVSQTRLTVTASTENHIILHYVTCMSLDYIAHCVTSCDSSILCRITSHYTVLRHTAPYYITAYQYVTSHNSTIHHILHLTAARRH